MSEKRPLHSRLASYAKLAGLAYLFFFAIDMMGTGMKMSFGPAVKAFLHDNASSFTELASFVVGIIGTAFVQSSSTVTSMCVVMTQEGMMPIVIAAGIVHGANLGTSVTSSIVAFATETKSFSGNLWQDLKALFFAPRGEGFQRAVGTAVVHDMFNIIMITLILLCLELPFGLILKASQASAEGIGSALASSSGLLDVIKWLSPKTYTGPVLSGALSLGVPAWVLAVTGLPLLFVALRHFARSMKEEVLRGVDQSNMREMGAKLLGNSGFSTFMRGLVLTILVQSSSATTSLVVPLAAMGFFRVHKVFPFIMGANIGTTTTALLAAAGGLGAPGFREGMTIALCHLYLNALAVALAVAIPGMSTRIRGAAWWLARHSANTPAWLLGYLGVLAVFVPISVYLFGNGGIVVLTAFMLLLMVGPIAYQRRLGASGTLVPAEQF